MIIPGYEVRGLVLSREVDLNTQIQPAGIDLTVRSISQFMGPGVLDFSNEKRELPVMSYIDLSEDEPLVLERGSYMVEADPVIKIPMDMIAFAQPRSSLTRMGCGIHSGIWDPGYEGDSVFVLNIYNPYGMRIYKNARIAQLVYARMESPATEGYDGVYQGHGISDIEKEPDPGNTEEILSFLFGKPPGPERQCVPGIAKLTMV